MSRMRVTLEVEIEFAPASKNTTMQEAAKNLECKLDDTLGYVIGEKVVKIKRMGNKEKQNGKVSS